MKIAWASLGSSPPIRIFFFVDLLMRLPSRALPRQLPIVATVAATATLRIGWSSNTTNQRTGTALQALSKTLGRSNGGHLESLSWNGSSRRKQRSSEPAYKAKRHDERRNSTVLRWQQTALSGTRLGHGVPNQRYCSGPFNAGIAGKTLMARAGFEPATPRL